MTLLNNIVGLPVTKFIFITLLFFNTPVLFSAELIAYIKNAEGEPVSDALVIAVPQHTKFKISPENHIIDQINKEFVKQFLIVNIGSSVNFPNKDDIRHHVYSFSPAKPFELPLYSGTPASPIVFDKPGPVVLGCNIHDWMLGFIYVVESPYYGLSNTEGMVQIRNLPEDSYSVRVWQPYMLEKEEQTLKTLTLDQYSITEINWDVHIRQTFRIRRAPVFGPGLYN